MDREIKTNNERMTEVELNLKLVLKNKINQSQLFQQLLNTHSGSSTLALYDNKKVGES